MIYATRIDDNILVILERWAAFNESRVVVSTNRAYMRNVRKALWVCGITQPGELAIRWPEIIEYWSGPRHLAPATVKSYMNGLAAFMRYLQRLGILREMPEMSRPAVAAPVITFLSGEELSQVQAAADGMGLGLAVALASQTGLRRAEMAGLRRDAVDGPHRIIRVDAALEKGRGGGRVVPLADDLAGRMENVPGPYVLGGRRQKPYSKSALSALLAPLQAAFPQISGWHIFRHTFATLLFRRGVPLAKISKWLGHRSYDTTLKYYANLGVNEFDADINKISG